MRKLTQQDIDDYLQALQAEVYESAEGIPVEARTTKLSGLNPLTLDEGKAFAEFISEHLEAPIYNGSESFTENYLTKFFSQHFDIAGMENQIASAGIKHDMQLMQVQKARVAFFNKNLEEYQKIVDSLKPAVVPNPLIVNSPVNTQTVPQLQNNNIPTLAEAWVDFVKYKSDWTPIYKKEMEGQFVFIELILGADTPVTQINKSDIKNMLEVVENLPKRNKNPYKKMSAQECIDYDDIEEDDFIASKSVAGYLKLCQSLFSTYLTNEREIYTVSPTHGVKYDVVSKPYGAYSKTEMKKLVTYFVSLSDWKRWVFLLLAYTGARRKEIATLTAEAVRLDDDSGRYYLMVEDSKTEAGTRQIPLHKKLVELGFLDFSKPKDKGLLFPEITYNNKVTKVFHDIRETLDIPYLNDYNERRIVHSLRHTFITAAQANVSNTVLVQQVVGHEHSNIGQTQRYTHRLTVSELLCVVDGIEWI
ncbi:DUF3258 domain-containing protein [Budviciaceae bacterium BWR-B9]|uniref:DUF3258 domain-containing protein n=1 Tax=Limnobaculum allomyrinae TaxID=2791986 RepID=A0ABS1IU04_9GAMM|nr:MULTISPECIES: tyrosine-type recombinase/integrase [Limnobaculum]MBK5145252.1 DUF3258 domain-containing protein [Limnobaculum allomyrinae]MBV7693084.1 DUF3258 domain-containing protein [Limnobaculum sp. M2-1]